MSKTVVSIEFGPAMASRSWSPVFDTDDFFLSLKRMLYICYLVQFRKNQKAKVQALIDSNNKINIITLAYAKILALWTQKTNIGI